MIHRVLGSVAAFTMVATLAAGPLAGCGQPGHAGCPDRDEQRVKVLAQLPILRARPSSTEAAGTYSGCGQDDSGDPIAPYAGQRYRSTSAEPTIRAFYWGELMKDGWRNASPAIPPEVAPSLAFQRGVSCLVKDVAGTTVVFTISFDPAPSASSSPAEPMTYTVEASDGKPLVSAC
ncbi:hypothetical protein ACTOB_004139 [Actinoplanes oblitus]|uniref:Lipoprotein n=1 Tax=Actinoplanes oblitus TaxID=3040509 RepID=A0ABY8WS13_9ACTN|nr:hypothetical protein [Actinoplanes oblitus]WIN00434.1 hypothetical protein ACTOB_004139 [Actinoplanes oblitus]